LKIGDTKIETLEDVRAAFSALPHGSRVPVHFVTLGDVDREQVAVVTVDQIFFPTQICRRDDKSGRWPCNKEEIASNKQRGDLKPASSSTVSKNQRVELLPAPNKSLSPLAASIVEVGFRIPYRVDGVVGDNFLGAGVVLDAKKGLVVTDRDTVPVLLGDAEITVGGSLRIPATVRFVHPLHNFSIIQYDPRLLGGTKLRSAKLRSQPPKIGESLWLMGLTPKGQLVARRSDVTKMDELGLSRQSPPRFREQNIQLATLDDTLPTIGGVLADKRGQVAAFWFSFLTGRRSEMAGLPTSYVKESLAMLGKGDDIKIHNLGAELEFVALHQARERGLSAGWSRRFEKAGVRNIPSISRLAEGVPASALLQEGDLILQANGKLCTKLKIIEAASKKASLALTLLRDGKILKIKAATMGLSAKGTTRFLLFAGLLLQTPHWPLAADWGQALEGAYVSYMWNGSPASRYGLRPTRRIVAVDGAPISSLDDFLESVKSKTERSVVRIETRDLRGSTEVSTLLLDLENWPTTELRYEHGRWSRKELSAPVPSAPPPAAPAPSPQDQSKLEASSSGGEAP